MRVIDCCVLLIIGGVVAGCSPTEATTPVPTLTLIPATATYTPSPAPPTPSLETLPAPQDLFASPTTLPSADHTPGALIDVDPIAAELVGIAQRLVAQNLDLPTRRIQLVDVQSFVWTDSSLDCPVPGQVYTAVETNGYRIVVRAGVVEYVFHTDFDRVLPCDPDNERLPVEVTPEVTEETTEHGTPEIADESSTNG